MYLFAVEILFGDTWVRTVTTETQNQAEFWASKFEKSGQVVRLLTLRTTDGLWVLLNSPRKVHHV